MRIRGLFSVLVDRKYSRSYPLFGMDCVILEEDAIHPDEKVTVSDTVAESG